MPSPPWGSGNIMRTEIVGEWDDYFEGWAPGMTSDHMLELTTIVVTQKKRFSRDQEI